MDNNEEYIFDSYFEDINLNEELRDFYEFIYQDERFEEYNKETDLIKIRNDNYKRYNDINILAIDGLSDYFVDIVKELKKIYNFISPETLLTSNKEETYSNQKILDSLYKQLEQLENLVKIELNKLENKNNKRQLRIKELNYSNVDKNVLHDILSRYNNIVIYNAVLESNVFENYKRQLKRKKDLDDLYRIINLEVEIDNEETELDRLNSKITNEVNKIYDKISYLEDLIIKDSSYKQEFLAFKEYFSNLIAYDDKNYIDVSRVYETLCVELKIKSLLDYFEDSFVNEMEKEQLEEQFIYEKYGIKNIKTSLDYISANYVEELDDEEKNIINVLYNDISKENYDVTYLYNRLRLIVHNIWKRNITSVPFYKENEDFCFICSNTPFIDEKHQTILITSKMLERVQNYSDYQIGFICKYTDNILYITENEDIMTIDHDDMSKLKTPKQLEQEFLNFKVCNRIALNGFLTKLSAVYFIDDGKAGNKKIAKALSEQYHLPLIALKKDKI